MRYVGRVFRPPSEANSFLLQATIGCSWNHCTYCAMYSDKQYSERPLPETLEDIALARETYGDRVRRVFVMDGDALAMNMGHWQSILATLKQTFPRLHRVSCYATAINLLNKSQQELQQLRDMGLTLLYIGPESGDDQTLKSIAKGSTAADHVEAATKARQAGMKQSLMFLLGVAGVERSVEHAKASAQLASAMDPEYLSILSVMLVPTTPLHKQAAAGRFFLPEVEMLLNELRIIVAETNTTHSIFHSNHASNYLPLSGRLPRDRDTLLKQIDDVLTGQSPIRSEWTRGL